MVLKIKRSIYQKSLNKNNNMNKLIASFIFIGVMVFMVLAFIGQNKQLDLDQARYNLCVEVMREAIPNPNDTDERSTFLQDCYTGN